MKNEKFELTYGDKLVGVEFNPSGNTAVDRCKKTFAKLIDELDLVRELAGSREKKRQCSIAITEMQTAQMWMVKALTCKY